MQKIKVIFCLNYSQFRYIILLPKTKPALNRSNRMNVDLNIIKVPCCWYNEIDSHKLKEISNLCKH